MKNKEAGALFDQTTMGTGFGNKNDDLYEQAVQIVRNDKKASTSYIQRRLGIGYNKAATLIERMEEEGVITPADHVGRREVI
jgi:S-DNA-T family DNA segregation ATPase FtsK/SpoIIIE